MRTADLGGCYIFGYRGEKHVRVDLPFLRSGFYEPHSMRRPSCWSIIKPVVRFEKPAAFSGVKAEMFAYFAKTGPYRPFMRWRLRIQPGVRRRSDKRAGPQFTFVIWRVENHAGIGLSGVSHAQHRRDRPCTCAGIRALSDLTLA